MAGEAPVTREPTTRDVYYTTLVEQLDADPKTRGALRDLIATKFPDTAAMMPETHVKQIVQPALDRITEKEAALDKRLLADNQARARAALHQKFASLGVAQKDYPEIEKLMVERGSADPESLIAWWKQAKQIATPATRFSVQIPGAKGTGEFFTKSPFSGVSIASDMQTWRRERAEKDFADLAAGRELDPVA